MCITYFSLAHSARRDGVPDVLVGGLLGLHDGQGRPGATPFVPLRFVLGGILRLGGHVLPRISLSNSGACMGGGVSYSGSGGISEFSSRRMCRCSFE